MNWPLAIVKLIPNNNCRDCIFRAHSQKNFKPFFIANRNSNKRSGLPALSSLHGDQLKTGMKKKVQLKR